MKKNKNKNSPNRFNKPSSTFQSPQKISTEPNPDVKICLSIIVKNESKVIERMLKTVSPILDYYCVIDTGSSDGTQDIIRKFFEEKGIPGKVIDHKWKNFEDARNKALTETRILLEEYNVPNPFGFWIDADEQLSFDPAFNINKFKNNIIRFHGANLKVSYGGQNYFRMQLFSTKKPWRWYGPVHEVLVCDEDWSSLTIGQVEGLEVLVLPDGNSWEAETLQQKYEGHAKILEDYVANDPNKDPRWVFYLAQSYRDANTQENREKSLYWYEKRAQMDNGFWEEIYFSLLMAASLKASLEKPIEEILEAYRKCGKTNQHRCEHLIPIIVHYHSIQDFESAYIYSSHAMKFAEKSPFPHSSLFIDNSIYDWKIYDMHSISCWYSNRKKEGADTFKKLMNVVNAGKVNQFEIKRILENKKFFLG